MTAVELVLESEQILKLARKLGERKDTQIDVNGHRLGSGCGQMEKNNPTASPSMS